MNRTVLRPLALLLSLLLAFTAGFVVSDQQQPSQASAIMAQQDAGQQDFDWGTLYTYYEGESYGTQDGLAAVAVIKPGMEIHPPHQHAEEEYLMVVAGTGTWHLLGEERPAQPGDMLYASPWDIHGITNTGTEPLTFVVWKWNNKGVAPMAKPE